MVGSFGLPSELVGNETWRVFWTPVEGAREDQVALEQLDLGAGKVEVIFGVSGSFAELEAHLSGGPHMGGGGVAGGPPGDVGGGQGGEEQDGEQRDPPFLS